jgi:hypothetical protein
VVLLHTMHGSEVKQVDVGGFDVKFLHYLDVTQRRGHCCLYVVMGTSSLGHVHTYILQHTNDPTL